MASGDTKTDQYLDIAANGTRADLPSSTCCETRSQTLIRGVAERIMDVEDKVEEIINNPDVVDIVATYADLQAYDVTHLHNKDVIRVLADETHDGNSTYYRLTKPGNTWTYIGMSKAYSDFVGTDGTTAGTSGLVPAPSTTDAGKFLKADGTWDDAGSSVNIVQTTGTSQTDVMSQNATTNMVFSDTSTRNTVSIGYSNSPGNVASQSNILIGRQNKTMGDSNKNVVIGYNSQAGDSTTSGYTVSHAVVIGEEAGASVAMQPFTDNKHHYGVNIGYQAKGANSAVAIGRQANSLGSANGAGLSGVAIGRSSSNLGKYSVALGAFSKADTKGQVDISTLATTNTNGYNNSQYRLLTGLYDPQSAHDAATKGYVDSIALGTNESYTIVTSDWTALSASSPYTYQATVTATATLTNNSILELINDDAVSFATYGFAIGSVDVPNNQMTIYSVGQPSASVTLKVNIK